MLFSLLFLQCLDTTLIIPRGTNLGSSNGRGRCASWFHQSQALSWWALFFVLISCTPLTSPCPPAQKLPTRSTTSSMATPVARSSRQPTTPCWTWGPPACTECSTTTTSTTRASGSSPGAVKMSWGPGRLGSRVGLLCVPTGSGCMCLFSLSQALAWLDLSVC